MLRATTYVMAIGLVAAGCSQNADVPLEEIRGVTWTLVEVNGNAVTPASVSKPATLMLGADGQASGSSGCNQFGGPYNANQGSIRFGAVAMTRMACERGMEVENAFGAVFDAARTWRVNDGRLDLLGEDGRVLARFRRDA